MLSLERFDKFDFLPLVERVGNDAQNVIFVLDQFGVDEVVTTVLQRPYIFLKRAEAISKAVRISSVL